MKIQKDTIATLKLKVADAKGKLIEESKEPMACLIGGYGNTLPAVEDALMGQEAGFLITLNLTPETAFGERDESLLRSIAKKDFPPGVKVGGQLELREAEGEFQLFNVVKIKGDTVILDGNHPLAGMSLKVTVKVVSVRAASAEEVAHGHAHGDHGHHH
ncbi:FKBP-type peptidyl-prolyl cis-trans isomerase [Paucibacter sp. PLA-PC-4]|uniref:FKBP-type peptidyl-prolyl cis-trans isomerase n=1 Tax=Paucibacter sp. PLA-PC-4 TaxID=2993655 RepID=UPI0022488DBA|nr:FKBP-type peptidyl-prolyl cis-trans isomerase [Paucibacter sp. PLA-PC-4]MCX2861869.1 FKBP-type peptidyl-prolyl cis-trans isomerase [Paucibacter sp. PLA-PC-4]